MAKKIDPKIIESAKNYTDLLQKQIQLEEKAIALEQKRKKAAGKLLL